MPEYEAPVVTELGSVADFTRGEGLSGNHDSFFFFHWGQPPDASA